MPLTIQFLTDLFAGILETVRATYEVTEGVHPPSLTSSHHQGVAEAIAERDVTKARAAACGYLEKTQEAIGSGSAVTESGRRPIG